MKKIICNQNDRVNQFVAKIMGTNGYNVTSSLGLEEDGELIAGVVFDSYNKASINAHIAALPTKKWMTRESLWYVFYYPFVELNVKRINAFIPETNKNAILFNEHLGFKFETKLKDAHIDGDLLVYFMKKEDCRFLRKKNVKSRYSATS